MEKITPLASKCRTATPHDAVLNSECAYTFHSPFTSEKGIVVSLITFIGSIDDLALQGDDEEGLFVRIVKEKVAIEKDTTSSAEQDALAENVTKLGVGVEGGFQSEERKFEIRSTSSIVLLKKAPSSDSLSIEVEIAYTDENKITFPTQVMQSAESIIHHAGIAVRQDLTDWELDEEKAVSKYAAGLEVLDNGVQISPNPIDWKCEMSGDTENLWLNLSTGYTGGGRKNWDGSGGSNGALDHYLETGEKYPLAVKLGTITGDIDTADCYSYAKDEDGPIIIPNLAELLDKRGISVAGMQKTVKSTAELEVALNISYAFDAITESGAKLFPVSGPGLQGLQNLGNSCYINSVVQLLFGGCIPELSSRYGVASGANIASHSLLKVAPAEASTDLLCQTAKLCSALTNGNFARPVPDSAEVTGSSSSSNDPKYRMSPRMFKNAVGNKHVDFRTGQQQDAAHYLQYLFEQLDRAEMGANGIRLHNKVDLSSDAPTTTNLFSFKTCSRLVCAEDNGVKYKDNENETILSLPIPLELAVKTNMSNESEPEGKRQKSEGLEIKTEEDVPTVTLKACIDAWSDSQSISGIKWPHLKNVISSATKQVRFSNYPRFLFVQVQRYELGPDWVPRKLEVKLDVTEEIDLTYLKASGPQDGENIIPDIDPSDTWQSSPPQTNINEGSLNQLMDMGFGTNGCKRALTAVGGTDVEAAMNWAFEHNNDPDFNDRIPEPINTTIDTTKSVGDVVDENVVMSLVENLGCFTPEQVRAAMKECGGAADRSADWLFSHMDDLDGAIAALQSSDTSVPQATTTSSPVPLEDGEGKYILVGLISHIGKNTGSGHYVAHLKKDEKWIIFNDEKVALSGTPPISHAYLYLFKRTDSVGSPNPSY